MTLISLNDYEFDTGQKLGRGSSGIVYLGYHKQSGEKVAIKRLDISNFSAKMGKIWSEIEIMKGLSHPNVVKLHDVHLDIKNDYLYMILEYCDNSDLSEYIERYVMDLEQVHGLMTQIKDGLEYLYSRGIVHRDLKPHNLLMNGDVVKIADFGLSTIVSELGVGVGVGSGVRGGVGGGFGGSGGGVGGRFGIGGGMMGGEALMQTICGSPLYMSPEIMDKKGYDAKSDLWSLGIIMYQLIYRQHPFEGCRTFKELEHRVRTEEILFPNSPPVNQLTMDLLQGLLSKDSKSRMTWDKFFNHPWFTYLPQMVNEHLNMSLTEEDGFNFGNKSLHKTQDSSSCSFQSCDEEDQSRSIEPVLDDPHIGELFSRPRNIPMQKGSYRYQKYQERRARHHRKPEIIGSDGIYDSLSQSPPVNLGSLVIKDYQKMPRDARQVRTRTVPDEQMYSRSAPVRRGEMGYSPSKLDFQSLSNSFMNVVNKSLSWLKSSIDT